MGWFRHDVMVVIGYFEEDGFKKAHDKAFELFGDEMVSPIIKTPVNDFGSFYVGPDGSKEGWPESDKTDSNLSTFSEYLDKDKYYLKWVWVSVGGCEPEETRIKRSWKYHD
jgi:hypothetical protein